MHDSTKEVDGEGEDEVEGEDLAVIGDDVDQKLNFIIVSVLRAEGLPGFDSLLGGQVILMS